MTVLESFANSRRNPLKSSAILIGTFVPLVLVGCTPVGGGGGAIDTVLIDGEAVATRLGVSTAETNVDVFSCRATSQSATPLGVDAYFPATANHVMSLSAATTGLTIRVESDDEFVLWVRSDGGSFCNTEQEDNVARGSWSAGEYDIFIGSPTQGATIEYTLTVEVS
jgi:hypothetical protein